MQISSLKKIRTDDNESSSSSSSSSSSDAVTGFDDVIAASRRVNKVSTVDPVADFKV